MAFWIILGILALVIAIGILYSIVEDDWGGGISGTAGAVLIIGFIGAMICGIGAGSQSRGTPTLQQSWGLRALVTKEQTEGHASAMFFLGFGSASGDSYSVKSISYIRTASDGGSTLQKTTTDLAVIYEDGGNNPRVEDWVTVGHNNKAFVPWDFTFTEPGEPQHRFHIPTGAILESYEVTP